MFVMGGGSTQVARVKAIAAVELRRAVPSMKLWQLLSQKRESDLSLLDNNH